jgi:heptosyltransferase-3
MQPPSDDILDLVREQHSQAVRRSLRGLIIQPGAIGDCLLTLPLARFLKNGLDLGAVDILGHTEYLGLFPGRTCVDSIRSMDSMDLHRLFVDPGRFDLDLADHDPLIAAFAEYTWIVTFLGEPDGFFEKNLIYVVHCSHSAEVVSLRLKPTADLQGHLTEFHLRQFLDQCPLPLKAPPPWQTSVLIEPTEADKTRADQLLRASGVDTSRPLVVMHSGSGSPTKCWHVDNFLALAQELGSRGMQTVFLLGPAEQERLDGKTKRRIGQQVKVLPLLSLEEVLAMLSRAEAFVGNDSGISHLAGGLGRKTVVVFGPTDPAVYRPIGPQVTVFRDPSDGFTQRPSVDLQQEILAHLAR